MKRAFFRKHRVLFYASLTMLLAVICTFILFMIHVNRAKGAGDDYIKDETVQGMSQTVVTSAGSNLKGDNGSGAEPCSVEVPTAIGKKGTKTNPFVILEIVANKCDQQLPYLAEDEDSDELLDVMKIGIEIAKEKNSSFVPGSSAPIQQDHFKKLGQWFCNWEYQIFKIGGTDEDTETTNYTKTKKIYTVTVKEKDLDKYDIDSDTFKKDYQDSKEQISSRPGIDVEKLIKKDDKYAKLFEEDNKGKKIRKIAIEDKANWKPDYESKLVQEEESTIFHKEGQKGTGYIVAVEPGKGEFGFASQSDCDKWIFSKTGTDADRWIYVEDESDLKEEYVNRRDKAKLYFDHYEIHDGGMDIWWESSSNLYSKYNTSDVITGMYVDLSTTSWNSCKYITQPEIRENEYTFTYYGLAITTNILKRQLFIFNDEKDYEDFNLQVITMTPDEINELAKKDKDDKLDIIERADMFYLGGYTDSTFEKTKVHELYYKYLKGNDDFDESAIKLQSFDDNDLDWISCYKLIYRLCNNKNLPMILTQGIGKLFDNGEQVPMYVSETYTNMKRKSSFNNIKKLYTVCAQFDLTAKKSEDPSYIRTFYDDLLGQLKSVEYTDTITDKYGKNGSKLTGYYVRPNLAQELKDGQMVTVENAERCYHMWNPLTFWPVELGDAFYNADQITINIDKFVSYGYSSFFFQSTGGTSDKVLTDSDQMSKQDGTDGSKGNVAIPHNNGDSNYSTILNNTESAHVTNAVMNVAYQIMNNRPEKVNAMEVKVLKQNKEYVKMDDTTVLLDYVKGQGSYGSKNSYLKLQVSDSNNGQPGLITEVVLKKSSGKGEKLTLYKSKDFTAENECVKETYKDSNKTSTGYNVDGTLIAYVPYSLQKWANGYDTIEVTCVGRIYSVKKKKFIQGSEVTTPITISERTLFNLE